MTQIKLRRDTAANFTSKNPVLGVGEPAYETDTKKLKIGDGTTAYTQLEYFSAGGGGSTNISATLPLKIVDGVISLEVDGQTIQIVDGKLHANLDELGNEVNTLAGDVAGVQADLLKKQDGLVSASPIEIKKSTGLTVVGTPMTGNDFVMDSISTTSYCIFPENYLAIGNEYQIKFTTPSSWPSDYMDIFDFGDPLSAQYDYTTGNISVWRNGDGAGFDPVIPSPTLNTTYYIKTKMVTSTQVKTCYSTDGKTFTEWKTTDINASFAWQKSSNRYIGVGYHTVTSEVVRVWTGTIDLKECYVIANGVKYYMFPDAKTGAIGINLGSGLTVTDGKLTATGSSVPDNMVTTDTAQTITGSKTFNGTVTLKSAEIGNQISSLQVPLYTSNTTQTLTPIIQSYTDLDNPVSELRFGSIDNKLQIRGSKVVDKNNKKFLTQGNVTGTGNITVTETNDGVQISSTGELNNPYSLFDGKYSGHELNNLSWLKSEGQWNAKAVYPDAYDKLVKVHNGTETVEGLSVKLSTEEYTDYDFVLNTTDETFRLPLLNGSEDLPSNTVVSRADNTVINAGETKTLFTASHNGNILIKVFSTTGGNTFTVFRNNVFVGGAGFPVNAYNQSTISFDVKRGDVVGVNLDQGIATYNYLYSKAVGNGSLYYYVGETVQNANLIDAGRIGEELVDVKASIDGDWTYKPLQFASSVSIPINTEGVGGAFTYDLSNYLPSDGYKYEVTISVEVNNSSFCTLGYYLPDNSWYSFAKGGNPTGGWFNAIVDSSRQVKFSVVNTQEALMWANAAAYRRLGKKV